MKIIAFGDIHGATVNLIKLAQVLESADVIVFVGDGADSLKVMDAVACSKLLAVRGNCDFFCRLPTEIVKDRIFVTHGDDYGVKSGISALMNAAKARDAKLCFFGHNHTRSVETCDGIVFINPGTLGNTRTMTSGSYAVVFAEDNNIRVEHLSAI